MALLERETPDAPSCLHVAPNTMRVILALDEYHNFKVPHEPPSAMDVKTLVILVAGLAWSYLSKRELLPGLKKLRQSLVILFTSLTTDKALTKPDLQVWKRYK